MLTHENDTYTVQRLLEDGYLWSDIAEELGVSARDVYDFWVERHIDTSNQPVPPIQPRDE